jgi:hypothetical protein
MGPTKRYRRSLAIAAGKPWESHIACLNLAELVNLHACISFNFTLARKQDETFDCEFCNDTGGRNPNTMLLDHDACPIKYRTVREQLNTYEQELESKGDAGLRLRFLPSPTMTSYEPSVNQ